MKFHEGLIKEKDRENKVKMFSEISGSSLLRSSLNFLNLNYFCISTAFNFSCAYVAATNKNNMYGAECVEKAEASKKSTSPIN